MSEKEPWSKILALVQDFISGITDAKNALKGMLLADRKSVDNSSLPPGLAVIASIVAGGIDPRIIDMTDSIIKAEINNGIEGMGIMESTKMELLDTGV